MLISCLMSTRDRRRFVPRAIRCFQEQTWPEKELVILDDGTDPIADLLPADSRIRYLRSELRLSLQATRDATVKATHGPLMCFWDDDDWHGPQRLERQARALLEQDKRACLLDPILFHDVAKNRTFRWHAQGRYQMAVGTLMFTRGYYEQVPGGFPPHGATFSDQQFVRERPWEDVIYVPGEDCYVAVRHDQNSTGCTMTSCGPWTKVPAITLPD